MTIFSTNCMRNAVCSACSVIPMQPTSRYYGLHALQHRGEESAGICVIRRQASLTIIVAWDL